MARPRTPVSSHGEIHIAKMASGKWRARARYRFDDGRLRQVERFASTGPKARASLQLALTSITLTHDHGLTGQTSISELADRWLISKAHLAPRSVDTYTQTVNHLIRPHIGSLSVAEATTQRLDRFVRGLVETNGPGAAKAAKTALSGMLGLAAQTDAVKVNPVREVSIIRRPGKGATAIALAEVPTLLNAVRNDPRLLQVDHADLLEFLVGTGCRIGEALALRWEDLDSSRHTAHIRANVVRAKGRGLIRQDHPKTAAGVRTISLPAPLVALLRRRETQQLPNELGLVFPTVTGALRDPRGTSRDWQEARDRLGFPNVTAHSFRKTVATALDSAGLSAREIADYLGLSNPSLTQDVYMARNIGGPRAARALDAMME